MEPWGIENAAKSAGRRWLIPRQRLDVDAAHGDGDVQWVEIKLVWIEWVAFRAAVSANQPSGWMSWLVGIPTWLALPQRNI